MGYPEKRINIRVTGDDVPVLERFKEKGGNVSELFREQLRRWGRLDELRGEHELIELDMGVRSPDVTFYGTWIWFDTQRKFFRGVTGVAQTRKGKFVHYVQPTDGVPSYNVFDSVDDIDEPRIRVRTEFEIKQAAGPNFLDI